MHAHDWVQTRLTWHAWANQKQVCRTALLLSVVLFDALRWRLLGEGVFAILGLPRLAVSLALPPNSLLFARNSGRQVHEGLQGSRARPFDQDVATRPTQIRLVHQSHWRSEERVPIPGQVLRPASNRPCPMQRCNMLGSSLPAPLLTKAGLGYSTRQLVLRETQDTCYKTAQLTKHSRIN